MKKATRKQVMTRAAELGVEVIDEHTRESYYQFVEAEAPHGQSFVAPELHAIVANWYEGERGSKGEAWGSLLEDMA